MRPTPGRLPVRILVYALPAMEMSDLKLHPPLLRGGLVKRGRLIQRLQDARNARVVTILAPAGYGKTLLLAQWAESEPRPMAWLSLDATDNDPGALASHIAASLMRAGMISEKEASKSHFSSIPNNSAAVTRLIGELGSDAQHGILVIDNLDALRTRSSWDVLAGLVFQLDGKIQLVMASRSGVRFPVAALRSQGDLFELTASELALDEFEGRQLLDAIGFDARDDFDYLLERSEGWPVGLYLAGLAMQVGSPRARALPVGGDDLYVADYFRHEILDHLSDSKVSFLIRTSILDRLHGPLCDAVLQTTGSGRVLEELEQSNLFITRLDRTRDWHRYHRMFQDLLRAELQLREPEIVVELHSRAAEWFEDYDMLELSILHAQAGGDADRVARCIELIGRTTYSTGRSKTLFGWLDWLERHGEIDRFPGAFAIGAIAALLTGDVLRTERWTANSEGSHPMTLLVHALQTRSGVASMVDDARRARDGLPPGSPWQPATFALEGLGSLWQGEVERADSLFAQAISMSEPVVATTTATISLAERAIIAAQAGEWEGADAHCGRSLQIIFDHGLGGYTTSALTFALAARLARRRNEIVKARGMLGQAATLRPQLNKTFPGVSVQTHIEMARAYLQMSDVAGARLVLRDAKAILDRCPDLGVLPTQLQQIEQGLATLAPGAIGPSALTNAELRLLPLLASHLTFPEIGERLYISRHTVKAQAMSIYRKLGASKRSEAVAVAAELGFLGTLFL